MVASAISASARLQDAGQYIMYYVFGLVVQTFFFGLYTVLIWLSTRMLLERKLNSRVNKVMFGITTFMYLLSAAYWAYSVADGVDRMYEFIGVAVNPSKVTFVHTEVTKWSPLFNAATLINRWSSRLEGVGYMLRNHRKYLWITIVFLALTAITVTLIIAFKVAYLIISPINDLPKDSLLERGIDILQIATMAMSLLSNFTATGVGPLSNHSLGIFERKGKLLRTNRILLLVVESGVLYCVSTVSPGLGGIAYPAASRTLGDLYTPVSVQIAGAYPCVVLLLVSTKKSLSESSFTDSYSGTGSTPSQPIRFGTLGSNSTASTIDNAQKSIPIHFARNTDLSGMSGADSEALEISSIQDWIEADEHILAEAAIHNAYIAMGALHIVRACLGARCCVKRRESFSLARIGGLRAMDRTIRAVLARLGQTRVRRDFLPAPPRFEDLHRELCSALTRR
ncbi:hypothetical protein B0H13DRAFT_2330390 [Mycena leptocephala]|nr:hypothetical protein B0H13DRAFT_2330390 [Mycena leptocephala]